MTIPHADRPAPNPPATVKLLTICHTDQPILMLTQQRLRRGEHHTDQHYQPDTNSDSVTNHYSVPPSDTVALSSGRMIANHALNDCCSIACNFSNRLAASSVGFP